MVPVRLYFTVATLLVLCLFGSTGATRGQRHRPKNESPIDKIPAVENFLLEQMNGPWILLSVASKCQYLRENNFRVESTTVTLTAPSSPSSPLKVSTLRKLNQQCWDIRQQYHLTATRGRFLLKGRRHQDNIHVVVGETDYTSYAIWYYQKLGKISMKLYGRSIKLPDDIWDKFEFLAEKQNMSVDFVYPFPKYGFCKSADEKYTIRL